MVLIYLTLLHKLFVMHMMTTLYGSFIIIILMMGSFLMMLIHKNHLEWWEKIIWFAILLFLSLILFTIALLLINLNATKS